jgi:hypothetical protein
MSRTILDTPYCKQVEQSAPNPEGQNYTEHFDSLASFNSMFRFCADSFLDAHNLTDLVTKVIRETSHEPNPVVALGCLGSDGRDENAACSPLDIVALVMQSGLERADISGVSRKITEAFRAQCDSKLFGEFEVKLLEQPLSYFDGDPKKLWPDRITDAQPLALIDTPSVHHARRILVEQLKQSADDNGRLGRKVIEKFTERIGTYKKICERGEQISKGEAIVHFDLKEGCAYLDDSRSRNSIGPSSFKQNALRLVQSCVNKILFKGILRESVERSQELVTQLPANTVSRLDFFDAEGLTANFPERERQRLQDNYKYFLWQYHRSEWGYSRRNQVKLQVDATDVRERMADLVADSKKLERSAPTAVSVPGADLPGGKTDR